MARRPSPGSTTTLSVAGLFAGIGGIEAGLHAAGHRTKLLCEIDPAASRVLRSRFPDVETVPDVREIETLKGIDLLAAGFPCQDLSQAGRTAGITGTNSGLVGHVFRLLDAMGRRGPRWVMLENVSFMLHLDKGRAMRHLIDELESRGLSWAYRVVDTRAFGLPQRRHRVILVASRTEDPRSILFTEDDGEPHPSSPGAWCGFYWTEGTRGLGWAEDAVPTLKGGSTIGIPSPPAIWNPRTGAITTPEIRDAERLQGFDADWTLPALTVHGVRKGHRWKLVGNAVSVPVATWVGERFARPGVFAEPVSRALSPGAAWPKAAWGHKGKVHSAEFSKWPVRWRHDHLADFVRYPLSPLSERATAGFLARAKKSTLSFRPEFLGAVERHLERMRQAAVA